MSSLLFFIVSLCASAAGAICGIGGMIWPEAEQKQDNKAVDKLFIALMPVIIGIGLWNF